MFTVGKPNYALLGCRKSYSIGNRQTKKDALFEAALETIHDTIDNPNFVSIPDLVTAIYRDDDSQLNPIREALKSNSLFPCTTCLSASGNKILAYLAVLHDKKCLKENGDIDLAYTKDIIRSFFADETKNTIQFDDSAIRNLKSEESHFKFGKNRFAHLTLSFTSQDSINNLRNKGQSHNEKRELTTQMFQAFAQNDKATVLEMLCQGVYVDSRDENGSTPLMWAACNGWLDVAQDLFAKSLPDTINTVNKFGYSALTYACLRLTDIPFLTQLLARSSPKAINAVNQEGGLTTLGYACERLTDIPFLTQLLARSSPETINAVNKWGETALMSACEKLTDIPFLTQLLARSSKTAINAVSQEGNTALLLACYNVMDITFLTQLLAGSSKTTINAVNTKRETALLWACTNLTDIPFLTRLLTHSSNTTINTVSLYGGNTALMWACAKLTAIPFLTQLLAHSSPETINAVNQRGNTALLFACNMLTNIHFLTQLLERSSDTTINAVSQNGITVLISLGWAGPNHALVQRLLPLILPSLTWTNFRSSYKAPNMATSKTAWEIAHERGPGPWADIASLIGEAMLVECAQRHIPWGRTHHKSATQKKRLTHGEQTPANVCEDILLGQKKIPEDILGIIRNYNESAFNDPQEALDAINDFLKQHLQQKDLYQEDGSQLFESVNDVMSALHDTKSPLNIGLAEYASTLDAPRKVEA